MKRKRHSIVGSAVTPTATPRAGLRQAMRVFLVTTAVFSWVHPARADDRYWRNSAGGVFNIASNWNGGSPVPGANDIVHFGLRTSQFEEPAYAVSFTSNATNRSLVVEDDSVIFNLGGHTYTCSDSFGSVVGFVSGRTGRLSVGNGHMNLGVMTVGGTGPGSMTLSNAATVQSENFWRIGSGSSGGVSVSGTTSQWIHDGELSVGYGGSGALTISNGGRVENGTGLIGDAVGSAATTGTVTISGAASRWLNLNDLFVGDGGTATLNIEGGRVDCDSAHVSFVAGHTAAVNLSGPDAEWVIGDQVFIGDIGTGTMDITSGGLVTSPIAAIGAAAGSLGEVTVSGDPNPGGVSYWSNSGDMNVGHGGAGTLSILDGGRVDNGNSFVGRFTGSVGHVTVDGAGSLWLIAGALRVGGNASAPGGEGHVDIAGGTATVTGQLKIWNTTNTVVNLAGGTLNVASLDTTGNPARFNWTGGTLNITTGFSLGAGGPFGSSLTLDGSRILSSPGAAYINNGDQLTVAGGTLSVANLLTNGAFSMSAGSVTTDQLTAGNSGSPAEGGGVGTISISGGTFTTGPVYLGSASGGSGNLTVSGAGTLECSKLAANDLVVNGGAVIVSDPDSPSGEYPALYRSVAAGYYRNGAITVNAGTLTAPNLKLGIAAGMTGTYTQSGGAVNVDVLGVGNDGTLGGGAGIGMASLSGGTLSAGSVFLGSTVGGSGHLTVSGTGTLECEKLSANDLIVNGGSVTVEDPNPPGRLDPVLYRSLVGGHLRDGAIIVTAGTVTTPNVKLGATAGKTGTYTQTGGSLVAGVLGVGNDGTLTGGAGIGNATISGGSVQAGSFLVGSTTGGTGKLHWSGGTLTGQSLMMAGNAELGVDLSGTTPGSGYAQLQLTAGVDLTGTLAIARTKGFEPALGDSFVIISCNTLTGAFDRVTGMAAGPGKVFRVQYNANNVTLVVGPPAPGDFDEDGDVDGSDYVTLDACAAGAALSYAIGCPLLRDGSGHVAADFDADADVDLYDFSIYQRCYSDTDVPADPACAP